ncbi:MAG: aldo/keto reductase [Verrucomicrobiae bacterium]|nr:aldo/keto reductase [Verrucomicrobiae bacterium]
MNRMNRREFIGTLVAGLATAAGPHPALAAPRSPTDRVPLGKTGVLASFVGLGTGMRGGGGKRQSNHTRMGQKAFTRLARHAFDSGINFFDVADLYGTHPFLRDALKGVPREKYVIQSKIWFRPKGLPDVTTSAKEAVERFRKELGVDYIDIVLLHCTTEPDWTDTLRAMMDELSAEKEKGRIRAVGTSSHSFAAMQTAASSPWVNVQFARINHKGVNMDGKPEEIATLLKRMRAAGKAVIGMKIFGEGKFQTLEEREASLRFVVTQKCVNAMIIGFEKPEQIDETLKQLVAVLKA